MKKRTGFIALALTVFLLTSLFCAFIGVSAEEVKYVVLDMAEGNIVITADDFTIGNSDPIDWKGNYIIKYTEGGSNTLRFKGAKCRAILDNVHMSVIKPSFVIDRGADVTLILRGQNSVKYSDATKTGSAIGVGANSKLTIEAETPDATLEVFGGAYGAGIGSVMDSYDTSAEIVINGGVISAAAGQSKGGEGAGIGGARQAGAQVTINGGIITATGIRNAPGIGAGRESPDGSTVTINGGVIHAVSTVNAAGIGGGFKSACSVIALNGGVIYAASSSVKLAGVGIGMDYVVDATHPYTLTLGEGVSLRSFKKDATEPDELDGRKPTQVTLPKASSYLYIDGKAVLLDGAHSEDLPETYWFYFAADSTHTLAVGDKTASVTAGTELKAEDWDTAESPVTAPTVPTPERDIVVPITPAEIPKAGPDDPNPPVTNPPATNSEKPTGEEPTGGKPSGENGSKEPMPGNVSAETTGAGAEQNNRGCASNVGSGGLILVCVCVLTGTVIRRRSRKRKV